jgi:hypothetical protein
MMDSGFPNVMAACEAEWPSWPSDCSGFARAVAHHFNLHLPGNANDIIDRLETSPEWQKLGHKPMLAIAHAAGRRLVLGGLKASRHGHLVVIVPSPGARYPMAYWGRFGSVGRRNTSINWSWNSRDLPNVSYYCHEL